MRKGTFDVYNADSGEFFRKTRTVFLYGPVTAETAYDVCNCLKYLDYIDSEKPITLEINSPGGEVSSGLAIIDTIQCIQAPVRAVVCGMAASMAALIAACCTKGLRTALPHSTVMIHQPIGGMESSQASDIEIYAKNMMRTKATLNGLMAEACGKPIDVVAADSDRDYYMTADEAVAYGLLDSVVTSKKKEVKEVA